MNQARQQQKSIAQFEQECLETIQAYKQIAPEQRKNINARNIELLYLYLAEMNENKGDRQQAEKYYASGCAVYPDSQMIWYRRGKNLEVSNRLDEAEYALMRADELTKRSPWPDCQDALAHVQLKLWKQRQAMDSLQKEFKYQRNVPDPLLYQKTVTDSLWQRCRYMPRFQMLTLWAYHCPLPLEQDLRQALYLAYQNAFNQAIILSKQILQKKAEVYPARLIWLYCLLGQKGHKVAWDKHLDKLQRQLQKNNLALTEKMVIEQQISKAQQYLKSEMFAGFDAAKLDKQIADLQTEIGQELSDPEIELFTAYSYQQFGFHEQAIEIITALLPKIKDGHRQAEAYFLQSNSLIQLQKYPQALDSLAKAEKCAPDIPTYLFFRAQLLHHTKKYDQARQAYRQLVSKHQFSRYYYHQGLLLAEMKEYSQADASFGHSLHLYPQMALAWYQKAKSAMLQNRRQEALQSLQKAFEQGRDKESINRSLSQDKVWQKLYADPQFSKILRNYN